MAAAIAGKGTRPKFAHERQKRRDIGKLIEQGVLVASRCGSRRSRHNQLLVTDHGRSLVDASHPAREDSPPCNMHERAQRSRHPDPELSNEATPPIRRVLVDGQRVEIYQAGVAQPFYPLPYCAAAFKPKARVYFTIPPQHERLFPSSQSHTGIVAGTLRVSGSGWIMDRRLAYIVATEDYGDEMAVALAGFGGPLHSERVTIGKACRHILLFPKNEEQEFGICLLIARAVVLQHAEQFLP